MKRRWTNALVLLLALALLPLLVAIVVGLYFARLMVDPPRAKQGRTPQDEGMRYENIHFESQDGVPISAWFIPASNDDPRPAIAIVHGWTWNRLGSTKDDPLARIVGAPQVDLLKPVHVLHDAGYHVLMFDMRNHGRSGSSPTVTFGHDEAYDLLGAVSYLQGRKDVDVERIGALGYSMGANAVMFGCAKTADIKVAVVVQPVRPTAFGNRLADNLLGPLGKIALNVARRLYYKAGGPLWEVVDPAIVADLIKAAILYVQGDGDPWGDVLTVRRFYERSQEPKSIRIVPSTDRYGGYLYLGDHPEVLMSFLDEHLTG